MFDGREFLGKPFHPAFDGTLVRFQPGIVHNEFRFLSHCDQGWRFLLPPKSQIRTGRAVIFL
jgi:hypothetical protein